MKKTRPNLALPIWLGGLFPGVVTILQALLGMLGANPVSEVLNLLGLLALIGLMATLACTPLSIVFGWTWPQVVKKHLGLVAFSYATAHFLTWLVVDQGFALGSIGEDLVKRPFITVGFLAWTTLVPLALTSTAAAVRRLGFVRWKRLHRLVYVAGVLGVVHFTWRQKSDITEPVVYAAVLAVFFALRALKAVSRAKKGPAREAR